MVHRAASPSVIGADEKSYGDIANISDTHHHLERGAQALTNDDFHAVSAPSRCANCLARKIPPVIRRETAARPYDHPSSRRGCLIRRTGCRCNP
jgi:hypothetical protein